MSTRIPHAIQQLRRGALALALAGLSTAALAAPAAYRLDPTHTDVVATWSHLGFSNPSANFTQVEGSLVYDAADPTASKVEVTLPLAGLDSHVPALDRHMRGPDMFDAEKFPAIRFRSTKVEPAGKDRLRVSGELTVKGVTRPAVLDVTLNGAGVHPMAKKPAVGFDATTVLKRSEFGIDYALPAVSDEIRIRITTEALAAS